VVLHGKIIGVNVEDDDSHIDTCVSLYPHKCRLTSLEKKKLTTFMLIVMIMMKEN